MQQKTTPYFLKSLENSYSELQSKIDRTGIVEEKPTFTISPAPKLNFWMPISSPNTTNFKDMVKPTPVEPKKETWWFSLVPKANAMEEKDLIQTYLDDNNVNVQNREVVFEMLKDNVPKEIIEDAIINKAWYKGFTQEQPKENIPWLDIWVKASEWISEFWKWLKFDTTKKPTWFAPVDELVNALKFAWNIPWDTIQLVWELGKMVSNPLWTAKDIETLAWWILEWGINKVLWTDIYTSEEKKAVVWWIKQSLKDNFWTFEKAKETIYQNPTDTLLALQWWLNIAKKGIKDPTKLAQIEKIEQAINPINILKTEAGAVWKVISKPKVVLQKTWDILPDRQKIAQNVSTKANRFNAVDEEKFIKEIWETPWEFAVTRWLSDVWEPAVEKATKNYLDSVKQADDAFEQIWWNYKYTWKGNDPIKISLDDLEKRYINTENDNLWRIQELKQKYNTDWLTFTEINELKRDYSRNFKYWFEDRNSEALARSSNIQNKLREWQFEKANEMWLENIRDINKNTKAWKMYADSLEKKINRSGANNAVSITDWIALSWWNASNLALFLGKKVWTSDKAKQLLIKTLWKTTKSPIIKPNVNKPQIKWLLWQWPIITPAPKWKSNIKVTPSTIQPNVNRKLLALPEWKKPAIITPQTAEKWVIQESKKGLKKAKIGMMNSSDVADNTRIVKDTIDSINDVKQLENLKSEIKELWLPRERELLSELQIKIDWIKELSWLDNIWTTLYKEYWDDLINDFKVLFKNEIRNKTTKWADKYSKVEFNTTPAFKNFKNSVEEYLWQNPWIDKSTQEIYDELKDQLTNTKIKDIKKPVLLKSKTNVTNNNLPNNRNNSRVATKLKPANKTYITQEKARELKLWLFANDRILLNKKLNRLNIDTPIEEIEKIGKILTNDAQKLAKIKVVIREHLRKYWNDFKNYMAELVDNLADILWTRSKFMWNDWIWVDKTKLLKGSDDLIENVWKHTEWFKEWKLFDISPQSKSKISSMEIKADMWEITKKDIDWLNKWFKENKDNYIKLYHWTSPEWDILGEWLKATSKKTSRSLQSWQWYVYLSFDPARAKTFWEMAYAWKIPKVYEVKVRIWDLLADTDQIWNKRYWWENQNIWNTLADSLLYWKWFKIKWNIEPYKITDYKQINLNY